MSLEVKTQDSQSVGGAVSRHFGQNVAVFIRVRKEIQVKSSYLLF